MCKWCVSWKVIKRNATFDEKLMEWFFALNFIWYVTEYYDICQADLHMHYLRRFLLSLTFFKQESLNPKTQRTAEIWHVKRACKPGCVIETIMWRVHNVNKTKVGGNSHMLIGLVLKVFIGKPETWNLDFLVSWFQMTFRVMWLGGPFEYCSGIQVILLA